MPGHKPGRNHEDRLPRAIAAGDFFWRYSSISRFSFLFRFLESTMKSVSLLAAGLLCASIATPVVSADKISAGAKVAQSCVMCHGDGGLSTMPGTPSLAGQPEVYLANQLRQFRDGKRHNEVMNVIAKPMSDADIDNVYAYFAQYEIELKKR
jgi:cytochrome c553